MKGIRTCALGALCFALLGARTSSAETTIDISGIGTQVDGVDTHVDKVTYGETALVDMGGAQAYEVRGTISGVGWGGTGVIRLKNAHYNYQLNWVVRWPATGANPVLVTYHHGGNPNVVVAAKADITSGADNVHRKGEYAGDNEYGRAALLDHATFLSYARRPLTRDGRFAATYVGSALTQAEAESVSRSIQGISPTAPLTYSNPELVAGAPIPAAIHYDSITVRDIDRALERVVASISGQKFRFRISTSSSAGSIAAAGLAFGCVPVDNVECKPTGGNEDGARQIFDGFIFNGFVYDSNVARAYWKRPLSGKVFFLQGRADERYQQPIRMAYELLQRGVILDGNVWIYDLANVVHVTRDNKFNMVAPFTEGEALGPYVGAAIHNMRALLADNVAPPRSHIAGRLVDDRLVFDVVGGTTNKMPVLEDLIADTQYPDPMIIVREVDNGIYASGVTPTEPRVEYPGATRAWEAVTRALPNHVNHEVIGPTVGCRVGGYTLRFFGSKLTPYPTADLLSLYGSYRGYLGCVKSVVQDLNEARLYQPRVESASETAARNEALFPAVAEKRSNKKSDRQ